MKIFYSIIVAFFLLLTGAVLPNQAYAVVCQNKTAIVYSNGMFNDEWEADFSRQKLKFMMIDSSQVYGGTTKYEYHLAYASDKDGLGTTFTGQLVEIFYQKQADVFSSFWRWVGAIEGSPQWFQDAMAGMAGAQTAALYVSDADFQRQLNGGSSVENPGYRKLLNDGKRIVIVSHSQGNFYANAVYTTLTTENATWTNSIGNVQVATPAAANLGAKLGNNEPQITVPEDLTMTIVHALSPGLVMPTKPPRGNLGPPNKSPNYNELGGLIARNAATYGHNFVKWYLAGSYTRDFILNGIVQTLEQINPATLSVADVSVAEGNAGSVSYLDFTVSVCGLSTNDITVDYYTSDGTATAADYSPVSGTLVIPAGNSAGTVSVGVINDMDYEVNETLSLSLLNPVNTTIDTPLAIGTILDDDNTSGLYYRDDWTTYRGHRMVNSWGTSYILKHLRDDNRGLAYSVDVQHQLNAVVQEAVSIRIYDYITHQSETLNISNFPPVVGNKSDDVVLWDGGLLLLHYGYAGNSIPWTKLTILDNGAGGGVPRWTEGAREEGVFTLPSYQHLGLVEVPSPFRWEYWEFKYTSSNLWNWASGIYRTGSYNYKVAMTSYSISYLDAPVGVVLRRGSAALSAGKGTGNSEVHYNTMNIDNGIISSGNIQAAAINTSCVWVTDPLYGEMRTVVQNNTPTISLGFEQSVAFRRTQPYFVANGFSNSILYWRYVNCGDGSFSLFATTNGILLSSVSASLSSSSVSASLSSTMSLLTDANGTHKLGKNGVVFGGGLVNLPVTIPYLGTFTNPVYITPAQKAFLEAP